MNKLRMAFFALLGVWFARAGTRAGGRGGQRRVDQQVQGAGAGFGLRAGGRAGAIGQSRRRGGGGRGRGPQPRRRRAHPDLRFSPRLHRAICSFTLVVVFAKL